MTDEQFERRIREALARAPEPEEPRSLHAFLAEVPTSAVRPAQSLRAWPTRSWTSRPALAGLAAAVVIAVIGGTVLLTGTPPPAPSSSPGPSGSAGPSPSTLVLPPSIVIKAPTELAEHPGSVAALAMSVEGPIVAVAPGEAITQAGKSCAPSDVARLDAAAVTWLPTNAQIGAMAGDAIAKQPVAVAQSADCVNYGVFPLDQVHQVEAHPAQLSDAAPRVLSWKRGDPSTVAFWVPDTQKGKGGFISWSSDSGASFSSVTDPAWPVGWDDAGRFWKIASDGQLLESAGPGFSDSPYGQLPISWNETDGDVPIVASSVFAGHVLIAPATGGFLSVATDGSVSNHYYDMLVWRMSVGPRFVAVLGVDGATSQLTLAISTDGEHFTSLPLPDPVGAANGLPGSTLLALDDSVLLTGSSTPGNVIVWSVPVLGTEPRPVVTPAPTTTLPPTPSPALTSTWTPVALPEADLGGIGGSGQVISALPGGGFIYFAVQSATRTDVFTSPDGSDWTRTGQVTGAYASGIRGPVASNGHVYVAIGDESGGGFYGEQENGAAWVSADLKHWTKAPDQVAFAGAGLRAIAYGPAGFVAIGYAKSGRTVWTSPTGLKWAVVTDERFFPSEQTEPTSIVPTLDGLLMVGRIGSDAVSWTTTDGQRWTIHRLGSAESGLAVMAMATGQAGYVGLVSGGPAIEVSPGDTRQPVTPWVSQDGKTWQAGPPSAALFGAYATIVALPGGYVAADVGGGPLPGPWTSTNGLDWVPVAGVDLTGVTIQSLVSDGRHALLIGADDAGRVVLVCDAVHD